MKERIPLDDFFRDRLGEYESPVSDSIFDRLTGEREAAVPEENATDFFKDKLEGFESAIPPLAFDSIMQTRGANAAEAFVSNAFKQKLAGFTSEIPGGMFERIMSARRQRHFVAGLLQPKRLALAATILLLLGGSIYSFFNQKESPSLKSNAVVSENNIDRNQNNAPQSVGNEGLISKEKQTNAIENQTNIQSDISNFDKNTSIDDIKKAAIPQTIFQTKPIIFSKNQVAENNIKSINKGASTTSVVLGEANNFTQPTKTPPSQQNNISEQSISKTDDVPQNANYSITPLLKLENTYLLDRQAEGVAFSLNHNALMNELNCKSLPDGCPTFGKRQMGKTWYIEAYGAPELAMRRLQAKSSEFEPYRLARDTSETVLIGYSIGVRAAMVFDNGLVIKSGLQYSNGRERFERDSVGFGKVTTTTVFDPIKNTTDTTIITEVGIYRTTRFNQYRSLDFSIQAGYEFSLNSRFTLGLNGGANLNLGQSKKATFYDSALQIQNMGDRESVFYRSLGLSLVGSVTAYWQMTERTQLLIEPYVRHYLKPITNDNYQIQQSYTNLGLAVGLRFRL